MTTPEQMSHDQAIELLPWLVNESLDESERVAVDEHARSCVICRRELAELQALQQSIDSAAATVATPAPDMRRINARIDAQLDREASRFAWLTDIGEFLRSPWRFAVVAQAAALVAIAVIWVDGREQDPAFVTLTTPQTLPAGQYVRVVFDPTLETAALNSLLDSTGLVVVAGPSERGVYTLAFRDKLASDAQDSIVNHLRASDQVLFVQAVEGASQ